MNSYQARIRVQLKESILDPQGQAVIHALHNLGKQEVRSVRIGKYIELALQASDESSAREQVRGYCESLLSNPVIETYDFDLQAN